MSFLMFKKNHWVCSQEDVRKKIQKKMFAVQLETNLQSWSVGVPFKYKFHETLTLLQKLNIISERKK